MIWNILYYFLCAIAWWFVVSIVIIGGWMAIVCLSRRIKQ